MGVYQRVFGANNTEPEPAALLEFLASLGQSLEGHFQGDEEGWFRLRIIRNGATMRIERFLASESGLRDELNIWAAWVEAAGDGPEHTALMQRLITAQQLMVLHDFPVAMARPTCSYLASATDGIYQQDDGGFFTADGKPIV